MLALVGLGERLHTPNEMHKTRARARSRGWDFGRTVLKCLVCVCVCVDGWGAMFMGARGSVTKINTSTWRRREALRWAASDRPEAFRQFSNGLELAIQLLMVAFRGVHAARASVGYSWFE